jgi:hypothetical protein
MPLHFVSQHTSILAWVEHDESCSNATIQLLAILPYASWKRKMSEVGENLMKSLRSEYLH